AGVRHLRLHQPLRRRRPGGRRSRAPARPRRRPARRPPGRARRGRGRGALAGGPGARHRAAPRRARARPGGVRGAGGAAAAGGIGQLRGGLVLGLEDSASRMARIAKAELLYDELPSVEDVLARIEAVTLEDVRSLAAAILDRPPVLAMVGPTA